MTDTKPEIIVYVDTREQKNGPILARLSELGIRFKQKKLDYTDYSFEHNSKSYETICGIERKNSLLELAGNFCKGRMRFEKEFARALADGCKVTLLVEDENARNKMVLRKDLDIIASNKQKEIDLKENEILENQDNDFLFGLEMDGIDNMKRELEKDYEFAFRKTWASRFTGNSMVASIKAFKDRYNLDLVFCNKKKTADIMLEIFYKAIEDNKLEV